MATLTILENDADVPPGHLERVARSHGYDVDLIRLHAGDALPGVADVEIVAVLGGEMGAYDTVGHPYLVEEKAFLAEAVASGVPVLGICLGCQLLADALGGAAYLADRPEVALGALEMVDDDDVVAELGAGPSLAAHRDTWDVPDGGRLVARSNGYNHAFRLGSALGVQSHPEVTVEVATKWFRSPEGERLATDAGTDAGDILGAFAASSAATTAVAERFFSAWLDEALAGT